MPLLLLYAVLLPILARFPVPDAQTANDGRPVKDQHEWTARRRPEILEAFADQVYGRTPAARVSTTSTVFSVERTALAQTAIRKEIILEFRHNQVLRQIHLLLYLPAHAAGPVPVIAGLNFSGNATVDADPGISLGTIWQPVPADREPVKERRRHLKVPAAAENRGRYAYRWQVAKILSHGYGLATAYYGDIEPDFDGGIVHGVRQLFLPPGETKVADNEWGAIGAWAWGLSRIADYLKSDQAVDPKRIGIIGFSRLGKAALWTAAQDQRFSLVLSNESGMGGASLYRAALDGEGETLDHLNSAFPYWFCQDFHRYTGHADKLPVDGNLLLSLIAPRPLYVASAQGDTFSNPKAEFWSAVLAGKVYALFGKQGLGTDQMPPLNESIMHTIAYHQRSGPHEVTAFDWEQYLKFADMHWKPRTTS